MYVDAHDPLLGNWTEKQCKCLGVTAVWRRIRRLAGQPKPRAAAVCSRAYYFNDSVRNYFCSIKFDVWFAGFSDSDDSDEDDSKKKTKQILKRQHADANPLITDLDPRTKNQKKTHKAELWFEKVIISVLVWSNLVCSLVLHFRTKTRLVKWALVCVWVKFWSPPNNFETSYPIVTKFWLLIVSYRHSPTSLIPYLNFQNCAREKFLKFIFSSFN